MGAVSIPGTDVSPFTAGDRLLSLLRRFRLRPREQQVIVAVLVSPRPLTVRQLAAQEKLHYSHAKATVRELVAWGILSRTPRGLAFQPEPSRWGSPTTPRR